MIIVRDIFWLQFGKAKEAIELLKQGQETLKWASYPVDRILADVTEYYTLVMENRVESLSKFKEALGNTRDLNEWQELYQRSAPLARSGRREVFRVVE